MNYQTTATIRQRGQLTIPEEARKFFDWADTNKVVSIFISSDAITIKPYTKTISDDVRWARVNELIKIAHSFKGGTKNVSKLIAEDRQR